MSARGEGLILRRPHRQSVTWGAAPKEAGAAPLDRDRLIEEHLAWARGVAWRFLADRGWSASGRDELVAEAHLALVEAARRFKPNGHTFRSFAWGRIRGAVLDEMRRRDPFTRSERRAARAAGQDGPPRPLSLDRPMWDESVATLHDLIAAPAPARVSANPAAGARLDDALRPLSHVQRGAVVLTLLYGYTLRDAGFVLGLSESAVCRAREAALRRIHADRGPDEMPQLTKGLIGAYERSTGRRG